MRCFPKLAAVSFVLFVVVVAFVRVPPTAGRPGFKLGLVTAMHGRPMLSALFLKYFQDMSLHNKLLASNDITLVLVVVGSEGQQSSSLVEIFTAWHYVEAPNAPLSTKWNVGFQVCRVLGVDAVMVIGSDNFLSAPVIVWGAEQLRSGQDFSGIQDLFIFESASERGAYFTGYDAVKRDERCIGAGRVVSSAVLRSLDWNLYSHGKDRNLDGDSWERIVSYKGLRSSFARMSDIQGGILVDVKLAEAFSLTSFDRLVKLRTVQLLSNATQMLCQQSQDICRILEQVLEWKRQGKMDSPVFLPGSPYWSNKVTR